MAFFSSKRLWSHVLGLIFTTKWFLNFVKLCKCQFTNFISGAVDGKIKIFMGSCLASYSFLVNKSYSLPHAFNFRCKYMTIIEISTRCMWIRVNDCSQIMNSWLFPKWRIMTKKSTVSCQRSIDIFNLPSTAPDTVSNFVNKFFNKFSTLNNSFGCY